MRGARIKRWLWPLARAPPRCLPGTRSRVLPACGSYSSKSRQQHRASPGSARIGSGVCIGTERAGQRLRGLLLRAAWRGESSNGIFFLIFFSAVWIRGILCACLHGKQPCMALTAVSAFSFPRANEGQSIQKQPRSSGSPRPNEPVAKIRRALLGDFPASVLVSR